MRKITFLLALVAVSAQAKSFKATASGNWIAPQTWSCKCIPGSGDQLTIPEGIIVTITKPVKASSMQIKVAGELHFNNGMLQVSEGDNIVVLPGGRIVAKGVGGTIYVGKTSHYFEHGRAITGPATIGKTVSTVALMFFTAASDQGNVTLTWASAGEANVRRYEILSSADSVTFQTVGAVKGSNNPFRRKDYTLPAGTLSSEKEFYRLEAIRNDSMRVVLSTIVAK